MTTIFSVRRIVFLMVAACMSWLHVVSQAPTLLIFDTDMANDCDDAGALAVLHALADLGEVEILAVLTNRNDPANASGAAVDAINSFYGRPNIPIGTDKDGGIGKPRPSPYTPALRDEFVHDSPADELLPDALTIYRRTLAAQKDSSVVICSVGLLSNLEDLLRSKGDEYSPLNGSELIQRKVKYTVIMGGGFPRTSRPETNVRLDPGAAIYVGGHWPGWIYWQGFEVGAVIYTGAGLSETPTVNPVRRAFELRPFRGGFAIDHGKPSYDQATVMLAVRGPDNPIWSVSEPGRIIVYSDGHTQWTKGAGLQQYVNLQVHPKILSDIIEDLMRKPPLNSSGQP